AAGEPVIDPGDGGNYSVRLDPADFVATIDNPGCRSPPRSGGFSRTARESATRSWSPTRPAPSWGSGPRSFGIPRPTTAPWSRTPSTGRPRPQRQRLGPGRGHQGGPERCAFLGRVLGGGRRRRPARDHHEGRPPGRRRLPAGVLPRPRGGHGQGGPHRSVGVV